MPAPRPIRPIAPLLSSGHDAPGGYRETPPVMQGWSSDRHVPVAMLPRLTACEARALVGMAAADRWDDGEADFDTAFAEDFGDDDFAR